MNAVKAVLSSTILNVSGVYEVQVNAPLPNLEGIPSYVGHPDTACLLAKLGVEAQPKGSLFGGLEVGQSFVAVPLQNPNRSQGWTADQAVSGINQLRVTIVTRVG